MANVAQVYAKAIYEVAQEKSQLDQVAQELRGFQDLTAAHLALAAVFRGNGIDSQSRKAVLNEVLTTVKASALTTRFLQMVVGRGRIQALPAILTELQKLIDSAHGIVSGEVRGAVELSAEEVNVLGNALSKRVGRKVKLNQVTDPSLLGGVVATVAGKTFDASLRTQLERFKNELL